MKANNTYSELYKDGVKKLLSSRDSFINFLQMASYQSKIPIHSTIQLFAQSDDFREMATFGKWKDYGRQVTGGQRATKVIIYDEPISLFSLNQTVEVDANLNTDLRILTKDSLGRFIGSTSSEENMDNLINDYVSDKIDSVWTSKDNNRKEFAKEVGKFYFYNQLGMELNVKPLVSSLSNLHDEKIPITEILKDIQISSFLLKNTMNEMVKQQSIDVNLSDTLVHTEEKIVVPEAKQIAVQEIKTDKETDLTIEVPSEKRVIDLNKEENEDAILVTSSSKVPENKKKDNLDFIYDNGIYFVDRFVIDTDLEKKTIRFLVNNVSLYPKGNQLKSKEVFGKIIINDNLIDHDFLFETIGNEVRVEVKSSDSLINFLKEHKETPMDSLNYPLVFKEIEAFVIEKGSEIYGRTINLSDYQDYYSKVIGSVDNLIEYPLVDLHQPFKLFDSEDMIYQLSEDNKKLTCKFADNEVIDLTIVDGTHNVNYTFDYEKNNMVVDLDRDYLSEIQVAIVSKNYFNTQLTTAMQHRENFTHSIKAPGKTIEDVTDSVSSDVRKIEITDEHLKTMLVRTGTLVKDGKLRVQNIIQSNQSMANKTKSIKEEFGIGGGSSIDISEELSLSYSFNSFSYKLNQRSLQENSKTYNWGQIVKTIEELVLTDNYLSEEEKVRYQQEYPESFNTEVSLFDLDALPEISIEKNKELADFSIIGNDDFQYSTSKRDKIQDNLRALTLLKELDKDSNLALPEEQKILAKYVGWGGLAEIFDDRDSTYSLEREQLKELVSDSEYKSMRDSVLTAYYTSPMVINEMYSQLERMGFKGGRVLDPAMGTGNFFTSMPGHLKDNSELVGVELDTLTGKIAKQLTQNANIQIKGFESTNFNSDEFDVVVGNIPFDNFKIQDSRYKEDYVIHDYFFKRSLELVKEGGIVAFITSTGTLDKKSNTFREELSQNADFLGSVRLPNTAFKDIAGTSVTTDIIFLQKNTGNKIYQDKWLNSEENINHESVRYNEYYFDNPEKLLGTIEVKHFNGITFSLKPFETELKESLSNQLATITGEISPRLAPKRKIVQELSEETNSSNESSLDIDNLPLYTYFIDEKGQLIYRGQDQVEIINPKTPSEKKLRAAIEIRIEVQKVIDLQQREYSKEEFDTQLQILNRKYDDFVSKNGSINNFRRNLTKDMYYPIMLSLEDKNEDGTYSKSQIMFEPTINPYKKIESVSNAIEALHVSLAYKNKIDLEYMSDLVNLDQDKLLIELDDHVYYCPVNHQWITREEYLSGDVKTKLELAEASASVDPEKYNRNVEGLLKVQPKDIEVKDIDVAIGSTWLPQDIYNDFVVDVLGLTSYDFRNKRISIEYEKFRGTWFIKGRNNFPGKHTVSTEFGTKRANALYLLNDALNLKKTTIYDTERYYEEGKEKTKRILNPEETVLARAKQNDLHIAFSNWIFNNYERAERLSGIYNEKFNRYVTRDFDGSHLKFDTLNKNYELRPHQRNIVSRISQEGRALMAHVVGAGKTLSMIASGMTMKEQGTIHKPMYVVPNHLVNEFAIDIVKFYPTKNVLITTKKDFEKENRKAFVAKMTSGNFDAVVIGHSQFEKIPLSHARREQMIRTEIETLRSAIAEQKMNDDDSWSIKQMIRFEKTLEKNLKKLLSEKNKDDHITFESTGVDFLFVDEAHVYKNLYTYTKLSNVAGVNSSHSQRASDMQMKVAYLQEKNGHGKGVVMATGTPISNSMSELFTMQRYLQPDMLEQLGCTNFDSWASTFGEIISSLEINPEGSGYQIKDRFAKFHNLPELMTSFSQVADIQTADMLNLPTPEIKTGKAQVIVTEPTIEQEMLMDEFSERADLIRNGQVDPSEDNLLKLTHEAKLMAIDIRLLDDSHSNETNSKLSVCCNKVFEVWERSKENLSTQMIFSDSGTPKKDKFNVYDEIKTQLMAKGIPETEIAFIHDYKTDVAREDLFTKMRSGQVRVLLGSTSKVGTGTNIQDKLLAVHHVDCPWRPSDIEQRNGRIVRQGNENKEVEIYQYVTKGTFDSFLWQTQENKLIYINQVMNGSSLARSSADLSETVLTAAEIKALATSNPYIAEKMSVENELNQLRLQKNEFNNTKIQTTKKIVETYPKQIKDTEDRMALITSDIECLSADEFNLFSMEINGVPFQDRIEAGKYLKSYLNSGLLLSSKPIELGTYKGFELSVHKGNFESHVMQLVNNGTYTIDINTDSGSGMLTRIDNLISGLPGLLEKNKTNKEELSEELENMKNIVDQPFKHEEKLNSLQKKLFELDSKIEKASLEKQADKDKMTIPKNDKSNEVKKVASNGMTM